MLENADWKSNLKIWSKKPSSWFMGFWLLIVVVSGAILFMFLVGMVSFEKEKKNELWIEVNSQILNACFTLAALMNHPIRFYLLYLFLHSPQKLGRRISWFSIYPDSSDAERRSLEKKMIILLTLFHLNCFFQYPITFAMWNYHYTQRPNWIVPLFLPLSFLCGFGAGIFHWMAERKFRKGVRWIGVLI